MSARYHSSMVNSGRCRSPRSRSRNTRANSKIFSSPAASNFLQANSGEVRRYRVALVPSPRLSSVRGACRWVSLPGETCKIPVSTSAKPCSSNHALTALVISALAIRNGFRSACPVADHHGDGWSIPAISNRPECATERRPASPSIRSGDRRILLTLFDFLGDGAAGPKCRGLPASGPSFHVERHTPCPFARSAPRTDDAPNLAASPASNDQRYGTGYAHAWRLVKRNRVSAVGSCVAWFGHGGTRQCGWPRARIQTADGCG